jgi:hypothetical protein
MKIGSKKIISEYYSLKENKGFKYYSSLMLLLFFPIFTVFSQDLKIKISKPYLNIPVGNQYKWEIEKRISCSVG